MPESPILIIKGLYYRSLKRNPYNTPILILITLIMPFKGTLVVPLCGPRCRALSPLLFGGPCVRSSAIDEEYRGLDTENTF